MPSEWTGPASRLGRISRFGLLEMSRQRLRPSLGESSLADLSPLQWPGQHPQAWNRWLRSVLAESSRKKPSRRTRRKVIAYLPVDSATYLLNEKRPDRSTTSKNGTMLRS
jgi:ribonuclease E